MILCSINDSEYMYAILWRYLLSVEAAKWITYVTDVGQQHHSDMFSIVSAEWHQDVFHLLCFY